MPEYEILQDGNADFEIVGLRATCPMCGLLARACSIELCQPVKVLRWRCVCGCEFREKENAGERHNQ